MIYASFPPSCATPKANSTNPLSFMPMSCFKIPSSSQDSLLFTPGPLTTSLSVKAAMLHDAGSWHTEFRELVSRLRAQVLGVAGLSSASGYEAVLLQGSGTYGVEAMLSSLVPASGKLLILVNGAYGERMVQMASYQRLEHVVLRWPENTPSQPTEVETAFRKDPGITHVALVHCETTTGILNPAEELGKLCARYGKTFFVDAMSSFGALPLDFTEANIAALVSSPNKCLEGVPGFCFVIVKRDLLLASEKVARSLSLDLYAQYREFDRSGQFRYTPPTHAILAFEQALRELDEEGGPSKRLGRYQRNHETLVGGMGRLGFRPFLPEEVQSCVITAFHYPDDPRFSFPEFYRRLCERGIIIYPGKLTSANTFRIGSIGRLFPSDLQRLIDSIHRALVEMGCTVPVR